MQVLIRSLIAAFRNLLVARVDPALLARDLAPEDAQRATERAKDVPQATIVRALRVFSEALALARAGGTARLELETALLRFVLAADDPSFDALDARVAALEEGRGANAVVSAAPPSAATPPKRRRRPRERSKPNRSPSRNLRAGARRAKDRAGRGNLRAESPRAAWQSIRGKVEGELGRRCAFPLAPWTVVEAVDGNAVILKLRDTASADMLRDHTKMIEAGHRRRARASVEGDAAGRGKTQRA